MGEFIVNIVNAIACHVVHDSNHISLQSVAQNNIALKNTFLGGGGEVRILFVHASYSDSIHASTSALSITRRADGESGAAAATSAAMAAAVATAAAAVAHGTHCTRGVEKREVNSSGKAAGRRARPRSLS